MYRKRYTRPMEARTTLASMRRYSHLSQAELARRSGIPRTAINAYERGARNPTANTLIRLAEACGMTLTPTPQPGVDLSANAAVLEQVLELAELLPSTPRKTLEFPSLLAT